MLQSKIQNESKGPQSSQGKDKEAQDLQFLRDLIKKISIGIKAELDQSGENGKLFKILPPVSHKLSPVVFVAVGDTGKKKYPFGLPQNYVEAIGIKAEKLENIRVLVVFTTNYPSNDKLIVDYPGLLAETRIRKEYPIAMYEQAWRTHISPYLAKEKEREFLSIDSLSNNEEKEHDGYRTPPKKNSNKFKFTLSPEDINKAIAESDKPNVHEYNKPDDTDIQMDSESNDRIEKMEQKLKHMLDIYVLSTKQHQDQLKDQQKQIAELTSQVKSLTPDTRSPEMEPCMSSFSPPRVNLLSSLSSSCTSSPDRSHADSCSSRSNNFNSRNLFRENTFSSNSQGSSHLTTKHRTLLEQ